MTKSCVQDVLPLPGFCFFYFMETVFALTTEENRKKREKLFKKQLLVCVLRRGYGVIKKSAILEKVKTRVTVVTKIMFPPVIITLNVHI